MLFLRNFFYIASITVLLSIAFCFIFRIKRPVKISPVFKRLEISSFFTVLFCLLFYCTSNPVAANIIWGLYLVQMDVLLLCMIKFLSVSDETGSVSKNDVGKVFRGLYMVFLTFETLLLLTNFKTRLAYEISTVNIDDMFTVWVVSFKPWILVHFIVCLSVVLSMAVLLLKKIIISSKLRKSAYISLLILLMFTVFMDVLFYFISSQWLYNFSAILLGIMLIVLYRTVYFTLPLYVQKNIISISSENISDAIICFDENGYFIYGNRLGRELYDEKKLPESLLKYLASENDVSVGNEMIDLEETTHHYKVEFRRLRDNKKRNCGCYLKLTDCTKQTLAMVEETYKATHDELTGLYNRDYFFKEMSRILKEEPDDPRYLVCTDLKDFKLINELFGSTFGDRLLVRQAEMLKRANYPGTIWGRISGDRYAMLIKKSDFNPVLAEKNSNSIIEMENEVNFKLVIYIAVYEIKDPTENVHTMYDKTTLAIKNIPADGSKTLVFCDEETMSKIVAEKSMVSEFDNDLLDNQFEMYLQPQIAAETGKCIGAEALVRWNHPEKGLLYPGSFIKILEKTDQIYKLDFYIWERAVKKLAEWKEKNIDLTISINISVKDFYYADLYSYFTKLVERYGISPKMLNLEITESVINNDDIHCEVLKKLQEYGFIIEMDDFGSGYSSLNALKNISMDVLKLDMEFIRSSEISERSKLIVSSIVKMAKELNMKVISEGVETQNQVNILKEINVDIFQGYIFSAPVTVKEFEQKYLEVN